MADSKDTMKFYEHRDAAFRLGQRTFAWEERTTDRSFPYAYSISTLFQRTQDLEVERELWKGMGGTLQLSRAAQPGVLQVQEARKDTQPVCLREAGTYFSIFGSSAAISVSLTPSLLPLFCPFDAHRNLPRTSPDRQKDSLRFTRRRTQYGVNWSLQQHIYIHTSHQASRLRLYTCDCTSNITTFE